MSAAPAVEEVEAPGAGLSIWRVAPSLDGLKTAALGAFSCETPEAGARVIDTAVAQLRGEGFGAVLGPMDGDTWGKHRLVVDSDGRPPFLMEPENPPYYPRAFDLAGFEVVSRYVSAERDADVAPSETRPPAGLTLRNLNMANAEDDLRAIHALSLEAFKDNHFYVPISEETFLESYRPVLKFVDPELVFLAEDVTGDAKAFLFAIPDYNEGRKPKTVILKTYASRAKGGGSMLANAFHEIARRKGYSRIIHALMHESNLSATHSDNAGGHVFRRYALWGRKL
jgi:hypothetical protein